MDFAQSLALLRVCYKQLRWKNSRGDRAQASMTPARKFENSAEEAWRDMEGKKHGNEKGGGHEEEEEGNGTMAACDWGIPASPSEDR